MCEGKFDFFSFFFPFVAKEYYKRDAKRAKESLILALLSIFD